MTKLKKKENDKKFPVKTFFGITKIVSKVPIEVMFAKSFKVKVQDLIQGQRFKITYKSRS